MTAGEGGALLARRPADLSVGSYSGFSANHAANRALAPLFAASLAP